MKTKTNFVQPRKNSTTSIHQAIKATGKETLAKRLSVEYDVNLNVAEQIVNDYFEAHTAALCLGKTKAMYCFNMVPHKKASRPVRNPKTGEEYTLEERNVPKVSFSPLLNAVEPKECIIPRNYKDGQYFSRAIDIILYDALREGERIEIRGFGVFSCKLIEPRKGRNPKTGEKVVSKLARRFHFKYSKTLLNLLNS